MNDKIGAAVFAIVFHLLIGFVVMSAWNLFLPDNPMSIYQGVAGAIIGSFIYFITRKSD